MKCALFFVLALSAAALEARIVGMCPRTPGDTALSGIANAGDGTYWAVDDNGFVVKARIGFEAGEGGPVPRGWTRLDRFRCPGVDDAEGVAYDKADGTLWVADEAGPEIWHVDPKTRGVLGRVELPGVYRTIEKNRGIEALAIGGDGLVLWTANEDELPGDRGTGCVRLQRFSRTSVTNGWKASGQWVYRLSPGTRMPAKAKVRNGLAELCVTESGELLALEREKIKVKKCPAQFRLRLFRVELDGATDVSGVPSLAAGGFTPVRKIVLCDTPTGNAMYEAICPGPETRDGKGSFVLVSDGDKGCAENVMVLALP